MLNEEYVAEIQKGLNVSKNMGELYERNRTLIHDVVVKYSGYDEIDDLMQEAYFGLSYAAQSYTSDRGAKFATYMSLCVEYQLLRYLNQNASLIRIPSSQLALVRKYKKLLEEYRSKYGDFPSIADVASMLDMSSDRVEKLRKDSRIQIIDSLDRNIESEDDDNLCLIDTISDDRDCFEEIEDRLFHEELSNVLWELVEHLKPIERDVIVKRYRENMTLDEVGENMGKSAERIRQLQRRALRKLSEGESGKKLRPFLSDEEIYSRGVQGNGLSSFRRTHMTSVERIVFDILEHEK